MTTRELQSRLQQRGGRFRDMYRERVYRQLDALARRGDIRRIRHPGRRHIHWAHPSSPLAKEV
ncbi:hypothetical protein [Mycobacterium talmoniae]|uniref:hypothetical protein n=1 Tax=Mycobacterium talmoniae TaxID=1858794 RepID=UPI001058C16E|nr:hypothetical protein [Mycobacterium talmoniae]